MSLTCKYYYKGSEFYSYQAALNSVIYSNLKLSHTNPPIFYHSNNTAQQIKALSEHLLKISIESDKLAGESMAVSKALRVHQGGSSLGNTVNIPVDRKIKRLFLKDFGTLLHEAFSTEQNRRLGHSTLQQVDDAINKVAKFVTGFLLNNAALNNLMDESEKDNVLANLVKTIPLLQYNSDDVIKSITSIVLLAGTLVMQSAYAFPELKLKAKGMDPNFLEQYQKLFPKDINAYENFSASFDLVTLKEVDGAIVVVITEYKTRIKGSNYNDDTEALQLSMYQLMLKLHGISATVVLQVATIEYDADSEDSPIKFSVSTKTLQSLTRAKRLVAKMFKIKATDDAQALLLLPKVKSVLSSLYTNSSLRVWTVDDYVAYLRTRKAYVNSRSNGKAISLVHPTEDVIIFIDGSKESLREWATKEIQEMKDYKNTKVISLIEQLLQSRISPNVLKNIVKGESGTDRMFFNLQKYAKGNWVYYPHAGLEENGLILMLNTLDESFDVIVLTDATNFDTSSKLKLGTTVLGDCLDDVTINKNYSGVLANSKANITRLTTVALLNLFAPTIEGNIMIGDIKIIDAKTGEIAAPRNLEQFQDTLRIAKKLLPENDITISPKITYENNRVRTTKFVVDYATALGITIDSTIMSKSRPLLIAELQRVRKQLFEEYGSEIQSDRLDNLLTGSEKDTLEKYIGALIGILHGFDIEQLHHASTYGFKWENVGGVISSLVRKGEVALFAQDGHVLTGLALGTDLSVSYANPDMAVQQVSRINRESFAKVRRALESQGLEINKATSKFLDASKSFTSQLLSGDNESAYVALLQPGPDGKTDRALRFKSPNDPTLLPFLKEYLEILLWSFNKYRMPSKAVDSEHRMSTYADFKKTADYNTYLVELTEDPKWLDYPLRKARNALLIKHKFLNPRLATKSWGELLNNFERLVDPRNFSDKQQTQLLELEKSMTMFNQFNEDLESRANILDSKTPDHFEMNMNAVSLEYIFSYLKKQYYDEALDVIGCIIGEIRLLEQATGLDYSNTISAIQDRVKIELYGKHLVDPDLKLPTKIISTLRAVGSLIKIGGRPILFAKEMTASFLKIMAKAQFGYFLNDALKTKHFLKAYSLVYGESLKHMGKTMTHQNDLGDFSKVGAINRVFGIANFDMNIVPEKFAADRHGLFNATKLLVYTTSTAPDFYNRMAIFVAIMVKDGSYNAHKVDPKTGELVYDMAEDERFSEFWKHKDKKNYKDPKFLEQYALYEFTAHLLNKEGYNISFGQLNEKGERVFEKLPIAYTNQTRDSIKETIGSILGMYDHEEGEGHRHKTFSIYMRLFLTYMSGEVKKYFATGKVESAKGYERVKKDIDGNILYIDGYDINGDPNYTTKNETGELRVGMEWVGHPVEGLAVSFLGTIHDIFSGDFVDILKSDDIRVKQRLANSKVFLFNLMLAYFISMFLAWIWGGGNEEDIPTELAPAYIMMRDRVALEFSPWQSIAEPILNLNIMGVNYMLDFASDALKVVTRDDYGMQHLLYENISAFKDTGLLDK